MKTGNNTIHNLIQRLGAFFWMDVTLLLWALTSIALSFYVGDIDMTILIQKVDIVFTVLLSIPTLFVNKTDTNKCPRSEILGNAWKVSQLMLFLFGLINIFRFEIQSAFGFDSEFPFRASLLFVLSVLVYFSIQVYFLVKKIW